MQKLSGCSFPAVICSADEQIRTCDKNDTHSLQGVLDFLHVIRGLPEVLQWAGTGLHLGRIGN